MASNEERAFVSNVKKYASLIDYSVRHAYYWNLQHNEYLL